MQFGSITSGSSGNCIYVGSENTHILVDAGISGKRIEAGLNGFNLKATDLSGIFITHEHSDHIAGLGVMARRYGIDIYATPGTIEEIKACSSVGKIDPSLFHEINESEDCMVGDLCIHGIKVSHDAAQPVAYSIRNNDKKISIMTDLGYFDDYIVESISDSHALLLESNHDIKMLEAGSYPYILKKRILGDKGHLSNENAGRLLSRVIHDNIKKIFLGHLSQENNYPELAYETVRLELDLSSVPYMAKDFDISIAKRSEASELVYI